MGRLFLFFKDRILTERDTQRLAFYVSLFVHLFLFLVSFVFLISVSDKTVQEYRIPVTMRIVEDVKPPKKRVPKSVSKNLVSATASPQSKQVVQKPTRLPGDRDRPVLSRKVDPVYPKTALNNDWEGTVRVKVTISESGTVLSTVISRSSGHRILDHAFMRTVKNYYRFKPKRVLGENKTSTKIVSYTFSLDK